MVNSSIYVEQNKFSFAQTHDKSCEVCLGGLESCWEADAVADYFYHMHSDICWVSPVTLNRPQEKDFDKERPEFYL